MADPATLSDYDVECDWYLLNTCNYRCDYCFLPPEALASKLQRFATPGQWNAAFAATGKRWLVHITGGEPTVYPEFVRICELVTDRHVVSINSNLSRGVVRGLAGSVDPQRVSFINAGLHSTERARHAGLDSFLANARYLQDVGFRVFVTVVATPEVVSAFDELAATCAAAGLQLAPKVLRGHHAGRNYPSGYSAAERDILRPAIARAREHYLAKYSGWPAPSINVLYDDELLDGVPEFGGQPCSAGYRFVTIAPNGDVYRCGGGIPEYGNLLNGSFRLNAGPRNCDRRYCVYFCTKYTADAARHLRRRETSPALAN